MLTTQTEKSKFTQDNEKLDLGWVSDIFIGRGKEMPLAEQAPEWGTTVSLKNLKYKLSSE